MRFSSFEHFYNILHQKPRFLPREIHWELTYRCNLRCRHCYTQGLEAEVNEINTDEIKNILEQLRRQGVFWLTLSGGEPLMRRDFLDIYLYAKKKGFLISIFTNGLLWDDAVIRALKKSPPYSIEVTVNGLSGKTYETVTGLVGSFELLKERLAGLFKSGLPLLVKSNLLKPNQAEIGQIKKWVEKHLGLPRGKYFFKYDPFIFPRLNGDRTPLRWRLSFDQIEAVISKDPDMRREYEEELSRDFPLFERAAEYLYQCSLGQERLYLNPAGQARFCLICDKFGFDLKKRSLQEGVREVFAFLAGQTFKTQSRCRHCSLRALCVWCPAKAVLETGDEEKPVLSYCRYSRRLARATMIYRRYHEIRS